MLDIHDPVYGVKFGIEIANSAVFFPLHLLDQLFELVLCSIDLLFKILARSCKIFRMSRIN
jgi:hypothetical protein